MSEFKGTKGEWVIGNGNPNDTIDKDSAYQIISKGGCEWDICAVWKDCDSIEVSEANALLISKAPEMLEKHEEELFLLEKVAKQLDELEGYLWGDLIELINEKRQLIKKATEL